MITLFRKIRQKLLSHIPSGKAGNRITQYLAYAFGEIVLVMIGILLALQVNNWNEERKTKATEQKILISLLEEFEANSQNLDAVMAENEKRVQSALEIGKFTGPSLPPFDELKLSGLMVGAFATPPRFVPNQGVILETVSSGKLSILSNPELRKTITDWLADLERVKDQENVVTSQLAVGNSYIISAGNFRRHMYLVGRDLIEVDSSQFGTNDFKFLGDKGFENNLYLFVALAVNLNKNIYPPLKARTESIISLINQELK